MPSESIRERIVQNIVTRLGEIRKDQPVDDPYSIQFDLIQRREFDGSCKGKKYAVAVFDPTSVRTADTYPVTRSKINISLEFLVYIEKNEDPDTMLNRVFAEVERKIMEDQTCGGLAINCTFTGDEKELDGRFEKYAEGAMTLTVDFRHRTTDPRVIV